MSTDYPLMAAPYRWFAPGRLGGTPAPWLSAALLDELASLWQPGLTPPRRRLAPWDTVFADPVGQSVVAAPLLILELGKPGSRDSLAGLLSAGLRQRGLPVNHGQSCGRDSSWRDQDGRWHSLRDYDRAHFNAPLLLFVEDEHTLQARPLLRELSRRPYTACLSAQGRRLPLSELPVYPARGPSLGALFRHWFGNAREPARQWHPDAAAPPSARLSLSARLERSLGEALAWAQTCAMLPPPLAPGLADSLRQAHFPQLDAHAWSLLSQLPGSRCDADGLALAVPVLAALRAGFARQSEARQNDLLDFLIQQIEAARPEADSPAELEWRWYLARLRLEREPESALDEVRQLAARAELKAIATADLRLLTLPGGGEVPRAHLPLRRKPRQRRYLKQLQALAPNCQIDFAELHPLRHRLQQGKAALRRPLQRQRLVAAFAPDGKRLLSATPSRAWIWDVASGSALAELDYQTQLPRERPLPCETANYLHVAFSPDGRRIATLLGDQRLCLWDAAEISLQTILRTEGMQLCNVLFNPEGNSETRQVLAITADGQIWDASQGRVLLTLRGHRDRILHASLDPHGALLLSAGQDRDARLWDAFSGECLGVLQGHRGAVLQALFSPDGAQVLTASADRSARLWETASQRQLAAFGPHPAALCQIAFSSDGAWLASATRQGWVYVWRRADGVCVQSVQAHQGAVNSLAFSPDGRQLLSAGEDGEVHLWARDVS